MPAHGKDRAEERNFFCSIKPKVQGRALQRPAKLPLSYCVAFQSPAGITCIPSEWVGCGPRPTLQEGAPILSPGNPNVTIVKVPVQRIMGCLLSQMSENCHSEVGISVPESHESSLLRTLQKLWKLKTTLPNTACTDSQN